MAWLLRKGEVLASIELAPSSGVRPRPLAGLKADCGALLVENARGAHSLGSGGPIDVAYLGRDLVVLQTVSLAPNRLAPPRRGVRHVLQARSGAFESWGLEPGDQLEVKQ